MHLAYEAGLVLCIKSMPGLKVMVLWDLCITACLAYCLSLMPGCWTPACVVCDGVLKAPPQTLHPSAGMFRFWRGSKFLRGGVSDQQLLQRCTPLCLPMAGQMAHDYKLFGDWSYICLWYLSQCYL